MEKKLYSIFFLCFITLLNFQMVVAQQLKSFSAPADDFSKTFLFIYKDAGTNFSRIKGKEIKIGTISYFIGRKSLPGARSVFVIEEAPAYCLSDFGSFSSLVDAEAAMLKLSTKITHALAQKSMVKYVDSSSDNELVKRTAIAEIKDNGFYSYNILIDVVKKDEVLPGKYVVQLRVNGGEGTFYRFIQKNEPLRSVYFKKSFNKLYTQFNESPAYHCVDLLPGFSCSTIDSAGKEQLLMEKPVSGFPDARVEFECLTSSIRALLGEKFLYYQPSTSNDVISKVVFIRAADHELTNRKSISASLVMAETGEYTLRMIMFHP